MPKLVADNLTKEQFEAVKKGGPSPTGSSSRNSLNPLHDEDDAILFKMGYAPALHRGLNGFMSFAFGFTEGWPFFS